MYTAGGCGTSLAPPSPPGDQPQMVGPIPGMMGLGCPDCAGTCGMNGLTMDGSGLFGTGIFGDSVTLTDLSTWTWAEYATVAFGAYVLISLVHTTKAAGSRVKKRAKKVKQGFIS